MTVRSKEIHKTENAAKTKEITGLSINICTKQLTEAQESLINKGLNYVPTSVNSKFDFMVDFQKCNRKLRLKMCFFFR